MSKQRTKLRQKRPKKSQFRLIYQFTQIVCAERKLGDSMKNLLARLSVTSTLAIVSAGVLTISMVVVGFLLYQVALGQAQNAALKKQEVNLRVAATLFQERVETAKIGWNSAGNVTRIELAEIPEFTSHDMIDSIGRMTGETATVFAWDPETKDFWRKTTNIIKGDGKRAVGTPLAKTARFILSSPRARPSTARQPSWARITSPSTSRSSPPRATSSAFSMPASKRPRSKPMSGNS